MLQIPDDWHRHAADVVTAIGSNSFPQKVIDAINVVVPYNQIVIISIPKSQSPTFWISQVPEGREKAVVDQYLNGCYLLDPWYHAFQKGLESGVYFLEDIAPDDFYNSAYYWQYFKAIEIENEAVIAVNLDTEIQIQISMGILEKVASQETRNKLALITPFIIAASKKHWNDLNYFPETFIEKDRVIHNHVTGVLNNFGSGQLTNREREIAILIIRGYSLRAMSDMLGIAMGTIKVHCKNLYKKLDISSQSELFAIFLEEISSP